MTEPRSADISRKTGETDIRVALALDGSGAGERATGVGLFDHMLTALARHGALDLDVSVSGDLETGAHHTVEDTGIVIGQALDEALGDRDRHRPFRLGDGPDGRGTRALRARHLGPAVTARSRAGCPGRDRRDGDRAVPEFFKAVASSAN